jgi:solute carrier family 25 (mitochondrial carnitine/acylcarnitine transporter), member 20/29
MMIDITFLLLYVRRARVITADTYSTSCALHTVGHRSLYAAVGQHGLWGVSDTRKKEDYLCMSFLTDFVAGTASGCASVLASQPIDVVRVRVQTSRSGSPYRIARSMALKEGMSSFYKGMIPPMTGVGALMSMYFGASQWTRRKLIGNVPRDTSLSENMICGFVGGLAQAPLANVIELLKVRLQVQRDNRLTMKGMFREVVRVNGVPALGRGFAPLMWRDGIGYACYFGFCETALAYITPENKSKRDLHMFTVFLVGMAGGVAYWVPIFPLDTIKSKLHADSLSRPRYRGMFDCAKQCIVKAGGIGGLYRGLFLTVLYCLPKNAAKLPTFEFVSGVLH